MKDVLDDRSLRLFCDANAAVFYGYSHCHYGAVSKVVERDMPDVINLSLEDVAPRGGGYSPGFQMVYQGSKVSRQMKAGLVNVVADNYSILKNASAEEEVRLTKVIFCVDTNFNPDGKDIPKFQLDNFLSKTKKVNTVDGDRNVNVNDLLTNKELRRAYKLCTDPMLSEDLRETAKKTFLFVRVNIQADEDRNCVIHLEPLKSPFESIRWVQFRECREVGEETQSPRSKDTYPWRSQLCTWEERCNG
jgi:hypothetical protein